MDILRPAKGLSDLRFQKFLGVQVIQHTLKLTPCSGLDTVKHRNRNPALGNAEDNGLLLDDNGLKGEIKSDVHLDLGPYVHIVVRCCLKSDAVHVPVMDRIAILPDNHFSIQV